MICAKKESKKEEGKKEGKEEGKKEGKEEGEKKKAKKKEKKKEKRRRQNKEIGKRRGQEKEQEDEGQKEWKGRKRTDKERKKKMEYRLYENGCYDIIGEYVILRNAYPAIHGVPVAPVSVSVEGHFVRYQFAKGRIELYFLQHENGIEITCGVYGLAGIHDIELIANAAAEHVENVFVQGFGMGGPSGCRTVGDEMLQSNGLIALFNSKGAFFVYATDHRHYINRYCAAKQKRLFADDALCISGGFNLENTTGDELKLPSIFFAEYRALDAGLRACAGNIAAVMGARTVKPPVFHWCSWYYLFENISQDLLASYVKQFQDVEGVPFRYIQVDAGYTPHLGDWLVSNHRFAAGLKQAADTIRRAGYEAGIWIGPFIVGDESELFKRHPDWILYDLEGNPVTEIRSYNEPKIWGNADCNYYVLDTSHPDAMAYLKEVFETYRNWGFTLFKTDFMLWNMHDTAKVKRYDNSLTSVEILRNTLEMIRGAIGEESYLLGCIAPFLPFIGYADGMRIAGDVGAQWAEDYGPVNLIRELEADSYFNHVYWQNDPDAVLLREFAVFLKPHEVKSLALLQAVSGGAITTSDPIHKIAQERLELLRFIMPKGKAQPRFPFLGQNRSDLVIVHRLEDGYVLFAMNPTEQPLTVVYRLQELLDEPDVSGVSRKGEQQWYVMEYGSDESHKIEVYTQVLQPHDSVLLFLTKKRLQKKPQNLWVWDSCYDV